VVALPPDDYFDDDGGNGNLRPLPTRIPPNDLEAERAVLGSVIVGGSTKSVRGLLRSEHLYSHPHKLIFDACVAVELTGGLDIVTLKGRLNDLGQLQRVGGVNALLDLTTVPTVANIPDYCRRIVEKHALRQVISTAQRIAAEGYSATDAVAFVASSKSLLAKIETQQTTALELVPKHELFAPMPPIPFVIPELYVAPGRPTMVSGYGYSGKTVALQALLIAVATGKHVWGRYRVARPGRVLHIDHEQGKRATLLRYQRLSRALAVSDYDELAANLDVCCLPRKFRLSSPDAEDILEQACDGVTICALDSLHAATPGVDENDAAISDHVSKLLNVSDRTGCAFVLLHHDGKGGKDKEAKERARGSAAIYAACGTVLAFRGSVNDDGSTIVKVEMTKTGAEAAGAALQPFALKIDDVLSEEGQERWGLECQQMTLEQVDPPKAPSVIRTDNASKIAHALRLDPGMSGRELAEALKIRRQTVGATLDYMLREGIVTKSKREAGRGGGDSWQLTTEANDDV